MLEFTKESPKEVGWYWLKIDPEYWLGFPEELQKPLMVAVHSYNGEFFFEDTVNQEEHHCKEHGRLWAGPLIPPDQITKDNKQQELSLGMPDPTNSFPFESDDYEREFYCGTVLDGWAGSDTNEKFTVFNDAIVRACERSTDADVWGVYQVGKGYNDNGYRDSDRIVALVFKQNVYRFEPEPKECERSCQ